jgi:hypothetical protein
MARGMTHNRVRTAAGESFAQGRTGPCTDQPRMGGMAATLVEPNLAPPFCYHDAEPVLAPSAAELTGNCVLIGKSSPEHR